MKEKEIKMKAAYVYEGPFSGEQMQHALAAILISYDIVEGTPPAQ